MPKDIKQLKKKADLIKKKQTKMREKTMSIGRKNVLKQ